MNPRTVAPVHVTDSDEWDKVVNHLVQAGMLEREVPGDTLRYKGKKVLNGAFKVHKGWAEDEKGQWFRTLRLIINLIPSNGMQRRVPHRPSQKMGYAPLWEVWRSWRMKLLCAMPRTSGIAFMFIAQVANGEAGLF